MPDNKTMGKVCCRRVSLRYQIWQLHNGFALAEIVIALALVSMAVLIVGGLGQQVLNLAKSSRQTAATIEIRTKTNSISRNLDSWLAKMRSSVNTNGIYAACLPDNSAVSSIFKCPAVNDSFFDSNSELKRIAGDQLHVASAPIVDMLGDKLAGTLEEPVYLDLDGRSCSHPDPAKSCPLISTGFFLRSNAQSDTSPGNIRFVVKLEQNRNAPALNGSSPFRTQYLTIDVGSEWQQSEAFCPQGTLKMGYLGNGQPNCVNPKSKGCDVGSIYLGVDNSSNPICKAPPATCSTGGVVIDSASNELVCSSATPCSGQNEVFMGYYSGTGEPICLGLNVNCPEGQVQVGLEKTAGGSSTALCKQLPSCQDSQKLSYDGSQFVCQSASAIATKLTCPDGEYVSGLQSDGTVICRSLASTLGNTPNVDGLRPLMVKGLTLNSAQDFNQAILDSLNRIYNGNTSLINPILSACAISSTGLSINGSKGYFGDLNYCILHVCSGKNGTYPLMATLLGGCGTSNTGAPCYGKFSMSISCMY